MDRVVSLRPTVKEDLPVLFLHQVDPIAVQMAAFVPPRDRSQFETYYGERLSDPACILRSVREGPNLVGLALAFMFEGQRTVGYWIDRNCWGRGLATEALRLLLAEIEERPLYARAAADNVRSHRVLEKCGFARIATEHAHAPARGGVIPEAVFRLDPPV